MGRGLRVGLVGYGLAGRAFHAPLIATTPGLRLASVVTRDAERAAQASAEHPEARIVPTAAALWEHAPELDVVVIATPNATHVPLAVEALSHGLPVVVDKPLAATVADARRVVDEAARRGLLLTVYQNRRWDGDYLTLRALLAGGRLGEPLRFESRFERWRPVPKPGWREHGAPEEAGGGLYDLGSHLIDQALQLFGPAATVYAELDRRRAGVEVDDDAFVAITHASGVRSHLAMSAIAAQQAARFRLLGTRAAYVKFGLDVQEAGLRAGDRPTSRDWGVEPESQWGTLGAGDGVERVPTLPGNYREFYARLAAALRGEGPAPVAAGDAIATLEVIEAARRSAAERRVVALTH